MYRIVILLAIASAFGNRPIAAQSAANTWKGSIVDDQGKAVAGAQVVFSQKSAPPSMDKEKRVGKPMFRSPMAFMARTNESGRYELAGLSPGEYYFCVEASGYLTNCEWTQWAVVTVPEGKAIEQASVKLTKAATVTIRIADPLSLLKGTGPMNNPLVVGVGDQFGRLHASRKVAVEGNSHVFQADVPFGSPLHVWLHSWKFFVTDSKGTPIDRKGGVVPFRVAANEKAPVFEFTIAGAARPDENVGGVRAVSPDPKANP